jgi:N-acetyl-anhydromuramyl-L-alanine amidase AmpD
VASDISEQGWFVDAGITPAWRPMIEHGTLKTVKGIIVHQTDSTSADATLNSYRNAGANGAHFLIDKDGKTYQVASVKKKTWHVGKLRAKCLESHSCSAAEVRADRNFKPGQVNKIEMQKSVPLRFPSNEDAIGIELVGKCVLDPKYIKPGMSERQISDLTAKYGVFETVTPAQNRALAALLKKIQDNLHVPSDQVFPHSQVSRKNETEGITAQWPGKN